MKNFFRDKSELKVSPKSEVVSEQLLRDIYAYQQLNPILSKSSYLPFSTASLSPSSIAILMNDIVINKRKYILEFGSGITTYLFAKLCSINNLKDVKIISVDENEEWVEVVKELLIKDGIFNENIKLISAPLTENLKGIESCKWYKEEVIEEAIGNDKIDCVLVDGPSAWREDIKYSRYPALSFVYEMLAENSIVFLDDANRDGEKFIISKWKQDFEMAYQQYHSSFCSFIKGSNFNVHLFQNF